jgi:RNA-binding protein
MTISASQKRHLRSLAHHLKPVVTVGQHGLGENVLAELEIALDFHELVKVKISGAEREDKKAMIETISETCGADLVQTIGHIAVFFRRNAKKPKIALPRD